MKTNSKIFLAFILCLISHSSYSQKNIEIPSNKMDSLYFESRIKSINEYQLEDVALTGYPFHIRISMGTDIVDIIKDDTISVQLITFVVKDKPDFNKIIKTISYDKEISCQLLDSLISKNILNIKDDVFIGIDGQTYLFEIGTKDTYRIFSYWSPSINDQQAHRRQVANIIIFINEFLNVTIYQQELINSLPFGNYYKGMRMIRKE